MPRLPAVRATFVKTHRAAPEKSAGHNRESYRSPLHWPELSRRVEPPAEIFPDSAHFDVTVESPTSRNSPAAPRRRRGQHSARPTDPSPSSRVVFQIRARET